MHSSCGFVAGRRRQYNDQESRQNGELLAEPPLSYRRVRRGIRLERCRPAEQAPGYEDCRNQHIPGRVHGRGRGQMESPIAAAEQMFRPVPLIDSPNDLAWAFRANDNLIMAD